MATTLRSLLEEAVRDDWSLSSNAGPVDDARKRSDVRIGSA